VEKSPGFESAQVEVIPFGLNLDKYKKRIDKDSRKKYGINESALVIGFRSTIWNVKNLDLLLQTLPKLSGLNREIVVITVDQIGNIDRIFNSNSPFRLIELGWVDESALLDFYNCLDVFIAVSTGESFGFMPLEASAFGVSIICLKETAIAELVSKSEPDMVISNCSESLLTSLKKLSEECDTERVLRKRKILEVVQKDYALDLFVTRLTKLYDNQIEKWGKNAHQ
jgi:glycosyltransferase involved in cell wall biosynthesis